MITVFTLQILLMSLISKHIIGISRFYGHGFWRYACKKKVAQIHHKCYHLSKLIWKLNTLIEPQVYEYCIFLNNTKFNLFTTMALNNSLLYILMLHARVHCNHDIDTLHYFHFTLIICTFLGASNSLLMITAVNTTWQLMITCISTQVSRILVYFLILFKK